MIWSNFDVMCLRNRKNAIKLSTVTYNDIRNFYCEGDGVKNSK